MCGIFSLLNNTVLSESFIKEQFIKGVGRGPESSTLKNISTHTLFGFHRLAINGLNSVSDQPIQIGNVSIICNGEIYNYKELYQLLDITPTTQSDCEVIIHLYNQFGIEYTLQMLDGVFAFVLFDGDYHKDEYKLYIARDPYGIRPLYSCVSENITYGFASELKMLSKITSNVRHFTPGTYSEFVYSLKVHSKWNLQFENKRYHVTGFSEMLTYNQFAENRTLQRNNFFDIVKNIQKYLKVAVYKRCCCTERPIACLLSGGLDSSLITALVCEYHKKNKLPQVETYSIGLSGSEDLKHARIVADHLGTKHTEIIVTEQEFVDAIPEVIYAIESYDTTTVRASIGNYLLGKYIAKHSDAKVIFNGDGSDELLGGYLYMHAAPNAIEFDKETRRLLSDIYMFDVLRSDKSISTHGLEPRTPFLDRAWTQYYLSIPPQYRYKPGLMGFHPHYQYIEKFLVRLAFSKEYYSETELLPEKILWRTKEAFSDGVSSQQKSLFMIIQEAIDKIPIQYTLGQYKHNSPTTKEQIYYRDLFEKYYTGIGNIIPYFWMPKYLNATDPSARTLQLYYECNPELEERAI